MNLFEFARKFDTEEKCRAFLKDEREKHGIQCKNCDCREHFYLENKKQWQCRRCNYRTTLTSGTIFENTKLPIQKWMLAIFWMTSSKKSISTLEMMRRLELSRFESVNNLMKKIRLMMSHYNDRLLASDTCEADESYFAMSGSSKASKAGRGTEQAAVHILASFEQKDPSGKKAGKAFKNIKMDLIDDASAKSIKQVWDRYLTKSSKITTDKFKSYTALKKQYPGVNQEKASGPDAAKKLPWVHTMSSNYKKINLGIFHNTIMPENLQYNIDEYCFKTNLRNHMKSWMGIILSVGIGSLWNGWL